MRRTSNTAPVKMYTKAGCQACVNAKNLLTARGINIEEVRIDLHPSEGQKMMQITGRNTVPQIFIGNKHVGGCSDLMSLDGRGGLTRLLHPGPVVNSR